tara:strand:+ start:1164 stop:1484 length:321 start_codon:yes stop_codon:yes gene_type:complete
MLQVMIIISAVTSATAVIMWTLAQKSTARADDLKAVVDSQAVALRVANRVAEESRKVMESAQLKSEVILKERDRSVARLEKERVKLLKAGADPVEMAKVWNEVFGD